jgi:RNA polymerase sigma-70 factor (ECF subfamily)
VERAVHAEDSGDSTGAHPESLETTAELLREVRAGEERARDRLVRRYLPILKRWAHGRLPSRARDLAETDDLVQITLLRALEHVETFEPRHEGAFLAYLRQILLNAIRQEIRRVSRRPGHDALVDEVADPSLVIEAVGHETFVTYEAALAKLPEAHQEAVILRVEFGFSYPEIAAAIESPSANAARMTVTRALAQLAETMDDEKRGGG